MNVTRFFLSLIVLLASGCAQPPATSPSPPPTETPSPLVTIVPGRTPLPAPVVRVESHPGCTVVSIDRDKVEKTACTSETSSRWVLGEERQAELAVLQKTFVSFKMGGAGSTLVFTGGGEAAATPAEQRSIETWARLALTDAQSGQTNPTAGLVIKWSLRGGDVAYVCASAKVYATGFATVARCSTDELASDVRRVRLSAEQVAQVAAWADTFQSFDYGITDNPMAQGAINRGITFTGSGSQAAGEETKEAAMGIASGAFYAEFDTLY